ncbi:hypothetical protein DPMN_137720 [Dreissena polymorpha]|uniref:Uncharacterized protein n=1 Tax=Dreissena polymorpha TaxID=45954 RepID=A0A9D4G8E4_DREPO|nr:hypothetical protein DPMN_137720 [Dreissena polymorpha]
MDALYLHNSEPEFCQLGSRPEGMWAKPRAKARLLPMRPEFNPRARKHLITIKRGGNHVKVKIATSMPRQDYVESASVEISSIITRLGYGEQIRRWRTEKYK